MRKFAILALLSLAACGPTKQQIASQCELDADKLYVSGPPRSIPIAEYVHTCMAAHGYRLKPSFECGDTNGWLSASCYLPARPTSN